MSRKSVVLALTLAGGLLTWTPAAAFAQTQLIRNGAFAGNVSPGDWARSGNFYADSRFDRCRSCPGYAYVSNSDGTAGNNLLGTMWQLFAIPPDATSAQLTYWTYITSDDAGRAVLCNRI
ncbi:MAG: hypothetical protein V1790_13045 [Planctomycetota bacterium]